MPFLNPKPQSQGPKNGFTLIELMITISIIAILATVGFLVYNNAQKAARISKRLQDLKAIRTAIELYKTSVGNYPNSTTTTCVDLLSGANSLSPTYMASVPKDPNTTYCYKYTSDSATTSTEYKIRTDPALPVSEMGWKDYNTQVGIIDPAHDTNTANGCIVDTPLSSDVASEGWAYYTNPSACSY